VTRAGLVAIAACAPLLGAAAEAPGFDASASCERKSSKGRVLCEVEMESRTGRFAWADVVVVEAPAFAPPLRSRVGVADARSRTERRVRIPVAFIATAQGHGTIAFRARAVVCLVGDGGQEGCRPVSRDVRAEIIVGTEVER
jgi:hypothetical protein